MIRLFAEFIAVCTIFGVFPLLMVLTAAALGYFE